MTARAERPSTRVRSDEGSDAAASTPLTNHVSVPSAGISSPYSDRAS